MEIIRQSQIKSNKGIGFNSKNHSPAAGQFSCAGSVMIGMLYFVYTQGKIYQYNKRRQMKVKKTVCFILVLVLLLSVGAFALADQNGVCITKDPTDEVQIAGGTAWFVSGAAGYDGLSWTFMSPDGTKYSVRDFLNRFPDTRVYGENSTTLTVKNLSTDMNGWRVFCTFCNAGVPTDTAMAFLYVITVYTPAPVYSAPSLATTDF